MSRSLLSDAFDHHVWATLGLIEECDALNPEQLATSVPGTYGSILDTMRHLVMADSWYLFRVSEGRTTPIPDGDEGSLDLAAMRSAIESHGTAWASALASDLDPDTMIDTVRDDGSETHAPIGIRLAQALHHGTDHRSQICTALTTLGIEPPGIDLWTFGQETGRVVEVEPASTA